MEALRRPRLDARLDHSQNSTRKFCKSILYAVSDWSRRRAERGGSSGTTLSPPPRCGVLQSRSGVRHGVRTTAGDLTGVTRAAGATKASATTWASLLFFPSHALFFLLLRRYSDRTLFLSLGTAGTILKSPEDHQLWVIGGGLIRRSFFRGQKQTTFSRKSFAFASRT